MIVVWAESQSWRNVIRIRPLSKDELSGNRQNLHLKLMIYDRGNVGKEPTKPDYPVFSCAELN